MLHACCMLLLQYVQDQSRVSMWKHVECLHGKCKLWKEDMNGYDINPGHSMAQGTNCCTLFVLTSRMIIPTTVSTRSRMNVEIAQNSVTGHGSRVSTFQPPLTLTLSSSSRSPEVVLLYQRTAMDGSNMIVWYFLSGLAGWILFSPLSLFRCWLSSKWADFQDIVKVAGRALRQNFVL